MNATVVRASAGTGKTFRLAHRYLALLLRGAKPEEILATTFTRKAAGEILGRILTRLAEAATGEHARREMLEHLDPKPDAEPSQEDCKKLLAALLARLHAFQVRTMDSWFVHLARLHGAELGLPPAWRMLDPAEAEEQAAEQAAELIAAYDEARVRDLMRDLQEQEFRRGVHEGLVDLTNDGLEILRDSSESAWTFVSAGAVPAAADLESLRADLAGLEAPSSKHWDNNLAQLREAADREDWGAWIGSSLVGKVLHGEPKFDRKEIPAEVATVLRHGIGIARGALLHERARRLAAAREFLVAADARLDAARRCGGGFDFGDFPRWLAATTWAGETADFRLDGRLRHVLLDEFQDTATPQWRALHPLVKAALADPAGTLFCVGDGKQSIYGWRSGEPRLLRAVKDSFDAREEPLTRSFRTAQAVLDEVNAVFRTLPGSVGGWKDGEPLGVAASRFAESWDEHGTAKQDLPGRFELWAVPVPEGRKDAACVRALAMDRAIAIAGELRVAGRPDASVAILTRKNADVAAMVTAMRARGVEASAEGNVALAESLLVAAALAALDFADRPDDSASARLLAVSPLAETAGWMGVAREEFARRVRRELAARGYGAWLARLHEACAAGAADLDARRFARLVEAGHEWDEKTRGRASAALRPSAFAAHARGLRMEDPSPSVVRVMTVHKSKGLEFDAVVLALTGGRSGRGAAFWTERAEPAELIRGVAFAGNEDLQGADPDGLDALERATKAARLYDELCVLYVAMTRAKQRLEIALPEAKEKVRTGAKSESEYSFSLAGWLRTHYAVCSANQAEPIHTSGAARGEWGAPPARSAEPRPKVAAGQPWNDGIAVRGEAPPPVLPRWTASHAGKDDAVPLRVLAAAPREDSRPRGIAIHRLFEEIEWLEDFERNGAADDALLAVLRDLDDPPSAEQARAWIGTFRSMLAKPHVRMALTRPAGVPTEQLRVWRERRFAIVHSERGRSEPAILRGSFDRVVLVGPAGAPESATILDFKTGALGDAETERVKREAYAPQMQVYREALERLTGIKASRIATELCFVDRTV